MFPGEVRVDETSRPRLVRRIVAVVVVTLLAVAVTTYVVFEVIYDDTTTPVDTREVVEAFRESLAEAGVDGDLGGLPALGVYEYRTTGSQGVDALGGTTQEYPPTTTITVGREGCGVALRWDGLVERFEEWELCDSDGALVAPGYTSFRRFFGRDDRRDFTCVEPLLVVPADPVVGDTWSGVCAEGTYDDRYEATVAEIGTVDVAGEAVEAVHVRLESTIDAPDGDPRGDSRADLWFALDDRTLLRWEETTASTSGSMVGDVNLDETFTLELLDLRPSR